MSREAVNLQPGFVLHHRPYRDSSRLVDFFCRDYGRVSLVARGVRRPKSRLRSVLMPFAPLLVSWVRRTDLGTLTAAEAAGAAIPLVGDGLLCAYYFNELLLRLAESGGPQTDLFACYLSALNGVVGDAEREASIRIFEKRLLESLGYGLALAHDARSNEAVHANANYDVDPQVGPVALASGQSPAAGRQAIPGSVLLAMDNDDFADPLVRRHAKSLLREALSVYLGPRPLRARQVAVDVLRARGAQHKSHD